MEILQVTSAGVIIEILNMRNSNTSTSLILKDKIELYIEKIEEERI